MLVEVPFGRIKLCGIITEVCTHTDIDLNKLREIEQLSPLPPLGSRHMELAKFASHYYIHGLGETLVSAIPKWWKAPRQWNKPFKQLSETSKKKSKSESQAAPIAYERLNDEQRNAAEILARHQSGSYQTYLLNGVTGSGKTAVYLSFIEKVLKGDPRAQALIMLPEINLTPQLERRIEAHFPNETLAILHSGLTEKQRGVAWYQAMTGQARIVIGTRLAIMTPLPNLAAIVVDEENDASYKQQEGLAYSARDLAVWRAKNEGLPAVLVSATPSLQSWYGLREGRYQEIILTNRIDGFQMPQVELVMPEDKVQSRHMNPSMLRAIEENLRKGHQSLVLINRRGLAPAIHCLSCGWLSECHHCSSYMVLHRQIGDIKSARLCCHHCGLVKPVPKSCPNCGDSDLQPLGRGTQKIEDQLAMLLPQAKVLRVDTDTARTSKKTEALFDDIHKGVAEIIVGTQILAKGHDYQNIGLVCVLDADSRLYSNDYMASEHLFAQLVQVAGRAGRFQGDPTRIMIETRYPHDPVYQYLATFDVSGFLEHLMQARQVAALPPFCYQALVHAESNDLNVALEWLCQIKKDTEKIVHSTGGITLYDAVPKPISRIAGKARAQLLIESTQRGPLQAFLNHLEGYLRQNSGGRILKKSKVRWSIERDPLLI